MHGVALVVANSKESVFGSGDQIAFLVPVALNNFFAVL